MNILVPVGEIVLAFIFGALLGSRLRSTTSEGRVRVGYLFGILAAVFLYGAYDFHFYRLDTVVLDSTSLWPGLSGAFLFSILGLVAGREILGRRGKAAGSGN